MNSSAPVACGAWFDGSAHLSIDSYAFRVTLGPCGAVARIFENFVSGH